MIITFCGHSDYLEHKEDEERLLSLLETIANGRHVDFYLGGYGKFDSFAKKCAEKFKKTHNDAKIIFVTPYLNKWLDDRREYLEKEYDEILYPELENTPLRYAIAKRNEWMINHSDYLIAYVRTHYGGAYNALLYADKHKTPYTNFYLEDYELY